MIRRLVLGAAAALLLALVAAFVVTGVAYVPVQVMLGPCLRDWTSPSSYRPRASPLGSVTAAVGTGAVRVCYGRPSARGREVYGGLVPYGRLWRTGANEPTRLYTNVSLFMAGMGVPPGRYSLYTVPGRRSWEIRLSGSVLHWGNDLSERVEQREIGRTRVQAVRSSELVETFTIDFEQAEAGDLHLVLAWEHTRVAIPIAPLSEGSAPTAPR